MQVELVVVPDCPSEMAAADILRSALMRAELKEVGFATLRIDSPAAAAQHGFVGSPSFFVNGRDVLPLPDQPPALACRLYSDGSGGFVGVPPVDILTAAILAVK